MPHAHWFLSLAAAREKMEDWRKYYNEERPHGAIGNKRPIMLLNYDGAASPPSAPTQSPPMRSWPT
jgi:putative transposase